MIRIAFSGPMRSGKDSSAEYLTRQYLLQAKSFSFAKPLYDILYMVQEFLDLPENKDRAFLQFLGDWARQHKPTIWIDALIKDIKFEPKYIPVIVTDARYLNELCRLKEEGFIIIKIEADEEIRIQRGAIKLTHQSELEFDLFTEYDYVVKNNTSLDDLYTELDKIIEVILGVK